MKKWLFALLMVILACSAARALPEEAVQGEVLVKFKPSTAGGAISALDLRVLEVAPKLEVHRIAVPEGKTMAQFIAELSQYPDVVYAEPNYIIKAFATTPNDPSYPLQWGLPLIKAPEGWDITRGDSNVIAAVIDSGIDSSHPDLSSKITSNGYNFYDNNTDVSDVTGHGSHAAGIIAADTDNSIGIAGVSWRSKIMALRIMDASGLATVLNLSNALHYAADNGAKVINLSLGSSSSSETMGDAVVYAYDKGCVIVAATGNKGNNFPVYYPAALPQVIAVTAVDKNKIVTDYSQTGSEVDVCAPGGISTEDIYSTIPTSSYGYKFGTSMAAPHVSGLAALLFAKYPAITRDQVIYAITSEAEDLGASGRDNYYGYGLINVLNSLGDSLPPSVEVASPAGGESLMKGGTLNIRWSATDRGIGFSANPISLFYSIDNGLTYDVIASQTANTGAYSWTVPQTPAAQAKIKITASDLAGNTSTAESLAFTILNLAQNIYLYPSLARSGENITFIGLSGGETARIYDINGDLVKSVFNPSATQITWDGRNGSGELCSEGVYLYVVTSAAGVKKSGKLALIK